VSMTWAMPRGCAVLMVQEQVFVRRELNECECDCEAGAGAVTWG
jgi:hypothetical protein